MSKEAIAAPVAQKAPAASRAALRRRAAASRLGDGGIFLPEQAWSPVQEVLASAGRPLDATTRRFMESRFAGEIRNLSRDGVAPQRKGLTVGGPLDPLEQEADAVASRVAGLSAAVPSDRGVARPDFSHVRVHTDGAADRAARSLDAVAYTAGHHVVFEAGQYRPDTAAGLNLLAHELAHVAQHGSSGPGRLRVVRRRRRRTARGFLANIFRAIASFFTGSEPEYDDDDLLAYLHVLDMTNAIEDHDDSDNKARVVVRRWRNGATRFSLSNARKVLLIREMLSGYTGSEDQASILDLLQGSSDAELTAILQTLPPTEIRRKLDRDQLAQFDRILAASQTRSGPLGRQDPMAATHAATPTEHVFVESVLNPGSTLVPAPTPPPPSGSSPPPPPPGGTTTPPSSGGSKPPPPSTSGSKPPPSGGPPPPPPAPPILKGPPAMTGLPPKPGEQGAFEKDMVAALRTFTGQKATEFRALRSAGAPKFPLEKAQSIAVLAQHTTEGYFAPYVRVASREPSGTYHPGTYSLKANIHDQSEVPVTDTGVASSPGGTAHPGRIGWVAYWMAQEGMGAAVLNRYNCLPTRSPDDREFARVQQAFATDKTNQADIDDTIHGWPAEATAGVQLQPYVRLPNADSERSYRWDNYTTLLHEMMHILQHPNYERTYTAIGGQGMEILKEGMADVMRRDLWDGPGRHRANIATTAYAPLRRLVEGGDYAYDASLVTYHSDYPKATDAKKIVDGDGTHRGVGMDNAKAAFFMGHTELLGLGTGTGVPSGHTLVGTASYDPSDATDTDVVVAGPSETLATLSARTGAAPGAVRDASTGAARGPGAIAPGTRVRVTGVRYVRTIQEDTLDSIASQNGVTVAGLVTANGLPAGTPGTHHPAAGSRLLIPVHGAP